MGVCVDYTIKRELVQIYGEIERQLGTLNKSAKNIQEKMVNVSGDFEKIISEQCARLTEAQKNNIAQKMRIHRLS